MNALAAGRVLVGEEPGQGTMLRVTEDRRSRVPRWLLAYAVVVVGTVPWMVLYLLRPDDQHWMVDLEVYREAGLSNLVGRPVYEWFTPPPQNLPFTYPPFASILAIPLALLPFRVVGWIWFYLQLLATLGIVRYAGAGLIARATRVPGWLLWGGLTLAAAATLPVADGLRYGQVNAFLILGCLLDVVRPRAGRWLDRIPQGVLVGAAAAIKLTPAIFVVHLVLTRQWRAAATAAGTAIGITLATFVLLPGPSFAFWGGALQDPERLGRNDGTANQSLRGVLLRLGPDGLAGDLLWLALVALVLVVGLGSARRAHLAGDRLLAFCLVATTALLVSPVSWTHHFHWLVPTMVLLVATRRRAYVLAGVALWLTFVLHLTWWAHWRLVDQVIFEPSLSTGDPFWTVLHNSYAIAAVLTVILLARLAAQRSRPDAAPPADAARPSAPSVPATPRRG